MRRAFLCGLTVLVVAVCLDRVASVSTSAKSNSKTRMKDALTTRSVSGRRRRQVAQSSLTANEVAEILERHNFLRAGEGAANMEMMVYTASVIVIIFR